MIGAVAGGAAGAVRYNAIVRKLEEKYPEKAEDARDILSTIDFVEGGSLLTGAIMIVAVPVGLLAGSFMSKISGIESAIPVTIGTVMSIGLLWTIIWRIENVIRKKELKNMEAKYDPDFINEIRNFGKDC